MDERSRQQDGAVYEFGECLLDVPERILTRGCRRVHLPPKTYHVLVALVTRANCLVTKRELLERVWPDVFVEANILTVYVAHLRRALGDTKGKRRYIETVSGAGYRFVGPVTCRTPRGVLADRRERQPPRDVGDHRATSLAGTSLIVTPTKTLVKKRRSWGQTSCTISATPTFQ